MEKVVGIAIALFVSAIMLPVALNLLANSTTAAKMPNVDNSVRIMVAILLPVLAVITIILVFMRRSNAE